MDIPYLIGKVLSAVGAFWLYKFFSYNDFIAFILCLILFEIVDIRVDATKEE